MVIFYILNLINKYIFFYLFKLTFNIYYILLKKNNINNNIKQLY